MKEHSFDVGQKVEIQLWANFEGRIEELTVDENDLPTYTVFVPVRLQYYYEIHEPSLRDYREIETIKELNKIKTYRSDDVKFKEFINDVIEGIDNKKIHFEHAQSFISHFWEMQQERK